MIQKYGGLRGPKNDEFLEFQKVEISKIQFFQGSYSMFCIFLGKIVMKRRSEGPLRVQKIENFGSSRIHPKSTGIDQESIISHFGIIKTPQYPIKTLKKQEQTQNSHNLFAAFWALLDPVLGGS